MWANVEKSDGCWFWRGLVDRDGYGVFNGPKATTRAHRYVYEATRGPIPDDCDLDHLCRTRNCVNPDHLEAVSHTENVYRGMTPAAVNRRKTHCPRGHAYDYVNPNTGKRACRVCARERQAASYRAAKAGV
jgi:hypothetical protein